MAHRTSALPDSTHHGMGRVDRHLRRHRECGVLSAVPALRPRSLRCGYGHALRSLGHSARLGSASSGSFAAVYQSVAVASRPFGTPSQSSLLDSPAYASLGESPRRVRSGPGSLRIISRRRLDRTRPGMAFPANRTTPANGGVHTLARSPAGSPESQRPADVLLPD